MASSPEFQQTLGKPASFSGTALHTGEKVTLKLQPAPVDHGIKFKRKDLQDEPTIDATIENLKTVERATTIGEGSMRVHTVEHVLAALSAMGVDNAIVEMDANEPPIGDGSAKAYVDVSNAQAFRHRKRRENSFMFANRCTSKRKRAQCSCCCRTTMACGFRAPKRGQTTASRNSCRPTSYRNSSSARSRRPGRLFTTKRSSR